MRRVFLVAGVLVVLAGLVVFVVVRSGGSRPVTVDEAKERVASTVPVGAPVAGVPGAGVYLYAGSGREELDKPPKQQAQGPTMPATVTLEADGCWTFRIDYSTGHWQSWRYCNRDGALVELGGETFERWDFGFFTVDNVSTFVCEDAVVVRPGMTAGARWEQRCTGTSTEVGGPTGNAGPFTYVGPEVVDVGGTPVPAHRFHGERVLSGAQSGTETTEQWFAVADGMPLRNERRIEVRSDSPIGTVTYTETGDFTLASLAPA